MSESDWRDQPPPDPAVRRSFLDARRRSHKERYDELFAATYDEEWGVVSPSHRVFVERLLRSTEPGATILDAACGTGKYWPLVIAAGRNVMGVDQSAGMLEVAASKYPGVPTELRSLQDLDFDGVFDAAMCVDAMEDVGPEDWPPVLSRLGKAVKPGGLLYLTVEMLDEEEVRRGYEEARARGYPVVPGEDFDGTAYHFFPDRAAIHRWLAESGFAVVDEQEADWYRHLLLLVSRDGA